MDDPRVITLPISKNDRFYFTRKYDSAVIGPLLAEASALNRTIKDIPILPEWAANLEEELIRRSIFGTAAIEGNPLTEEEVGRILSDEGGKTVTERAEREIRNIKAAYNFVKISESKDSILPIDEDLVKLIHTIITKGIDEERGRPGEYRLVKCKVGDADHGGTYVPPIMHSDIALLIKKFCEWLNCKELMKEDPIIRAAAAHYHVAMIHPFFDGNGRTARLLEAFLLKSSGVRYAPTMLSNYYYRNIHDYYRMFSVARKHPEKELTSFLEFILKGLIESFDEIRTRITLDIRRLLLMNYYTLIWKGKGINHRQYDLLTILIDKPIHTKFTLSDFRSTTPFNVIYRGKSDRTIIRDIKKLKEGSLLKSPENGSYELNFNIL